MGGIGSENMFLKRKRTVINEAFADILDVNELTIEKKRRKSSDKYKVIMNEYKIMIDGHVVDNIIIDHYSNLHCNMPHYMPFEYLRKFYRLINNYIEEMSYHGFNNMSGTGLLIEFFEEYYEDIDAEYVEKMCKLDDGKGEVIADTSFRWWLVSSLCTGERGGNLQKKYMDMIEKDWEPEDFINEKIKDYEKKKEIIYGEEVNNDR